MTNFYRLGLAMVAVSAVMLALPSNTDAQFLDKIFKRDKNKRAPVPSDPGVPVPVSGKTEARKGHEIDFEIEAKSKTPWCCR